VTLMFIKEETEIAVSSGRVLTQTLPTDECYKVFADNFFYKCAANRETTGAWHALCWDCTTQSFARLCTAK